MEHRYRGAWPATFFLALCAAPGPAQPVTAGRCDLDVLRRIAPSDTTIVGAARQLDPAPHCRVAGYVTSTNPGPNRINFELVLPDDWKKRYFLAGNGGAGGSIQDKPARYLVRGMAAAAHDTGHTGGGTDWTPMLNDVARKVDWGYRSEHLVAVATQQITRRYYYQSTDGGMFRYFRGCSKGGGQAANLLENYPQDFDGIVAGTSGVYDVPLFHATIGQHILGAPGRYVSPAKLKLLDDAVVAACDGLDGARDGIVTDPAACHFRPERLLCRSSDRSNCLTSGELSTVKVILGGLRDRSGELIYPGYSISNATGWAPILTGLEPPRLRAASPWPEATAPQSLYVPQRTMRYFYFDDPNFDFLHGFDPAKPTDRARFARADHLYNAQIANPHIEPYRDHGGKVLFWAGWSDNSLSPFAMIRYYRAVEKALGDPARVRQFARLFMAPGVLHCGRGPGPQDVPDRALDAMVDWVEHGAAPAVLTASRPAGESLPAKSFLLCPYPQVAHYRAGEMNAASSWTCRPPAPRARRADGLD